MAGSDEVVVHCSLVNTILVAELVNKNSTVAKKKKNLPGPRDVEIDVSYLFCHLPFVVHCSSPIVHVICSE